MALRIADFGILASVDRDKSNLRKKIFVVFNFAVCSIREFLLTVDGDNMDECLERS